MRVKKTSLSLPSESLDVLLLILLSNKDMKIASVSLFNIISSDTGCSGQPT